MQADQAEELRDGLLARRNALLSRLRELRGGASGRAQAAAELFAPTDDNHAQLISHKDLAFALDAQELGQLQAIDEALARIDAGHYGKCIDCGSGIEIARLRAMPQALRCTACQQQHERAERRR